MSVPIIICDDSSFARKQVARALPKDWEVEITFATNGVEGVEAISAGKGHVLFLDLTMPEMDGFGVLEYIRENDLPTLPIVISGDIQPESYKRVMQLGAVAFINKPVDAEELCKVLDDYGVLEVLTGADEPEPEPEVEEEDDEFDPDFKDWCQELANIAMGRAADLLARVIEEGVVMSVPKVKAMKRSELDMMLRTTASNAGVVAINQGFIGGGMAGETMIIFDTEDIDKLASLMNYQGEIIEKVGQEILIDVANILVGAFLKGFADQLDVNYGQGLPEIYKKDASEKMLSDAVNKNILSIELSYALGEGEINCDQLVLFTEQATKALQKIIDYAMDGL